jgi:fructokinase
VKVLGFGAVLWDEIHGKRNIGGAVFNTVAHCARLGADAYLVSAVGTDELGEETVAAVTGQSVRPDFVSRVEAPTCVVRVRLDEAGVPTYDIDAVTSWDLIDVDESMLSRIGRIGFDVFCFGSIEQRSPVSRRSLHRLLEGCSFERVLFDMNLRLDYYDRDVLAYSLEHCDLLKLNTEEAAVVANYFDVGGTIRRPAHADVRAPNPERAPNPGPDPTAGDWRGFTAAVCDAFGIDLVCVTDGAAGAYLGTRDELVHCPGYVVEVSDTVGAGDAFGAALVSALHEGAGLRDAGDRACALGALVASKRGAVPDYAIEELEGLRSGSNRRDSNRGGGRIRRRLR